MSEDNTRKVAKALGWTIVRGTMKTCESCAKAKAQQKKLKIDVPNDKSTEINGRIYLDLSRLVKPASEPQPRRPNWCMIVDEATGFKTSTFHATKSGMVTPTC